MIVDTTSKLVVLDSMIVDTTSKLEGTANDQRLLVDAVCRLPTAMLLLYGYHPTGLA
jgi:hypothetical protein